MKVYSFDYCSCIYESSFALVSLHTTKAGAYKAMKKELLNQYMLWYNLRIKYGKYGKGLDKFGDNEAWCITTHNILD